MRRRRLVDPGPHDLDRIRAWLPGSGYFVGKRSRRGAPCIHGDTANAAPGPVEHASRPAGSVRVTVDPAWRHAPAPDPVRRLSRGTRGSIRTDATAGEAARSRARGHWAGHRPRPSGGPLFRFGDG